MSAKILPVVLIISLLSGCGKTVRVTNREFREFEPFEAKLVRLQEIPRSEESVPSAMALRDYRVTLRKPDGTLIVITRVSSIMGDNVHWPATIPVSMMEPTLKVGRSYRFPEELYRVHPVASGE